MLGGAGTRPRRRCPAGEQADRAGETAFQLSLELVDQADSSLDQLLAGPGQGTQHLSGFAVLGEWGKSVSVGAQHVGEQVGVSGVGLRPGAGVAAAQPFDLPRGDHHHPQAGVEQRLDQWAVAAFDPDTVHAEFGQPLDQTGEGLAGVGNLEPDGDLAVVVDDADGVGLAGPVDASEQPPVISVGSSTHLPDPSCDDGTSTVGVGTPARMLIAWRSNPRIPSAGLGVPARRLPQISSRPSNSKHTRRSATGRRFTGNHHCNQHPMSADTRMVDQ